jgi:hypothetical protein
VPPAVRPTTSNSSRGYFKRPAIEPVVLTAFLASTKASVSCRLRRITAAKIAIMAPITKGIRQPQAFNSSGVKNTFCSNNSTMIAVSWPPIRVTYWKLE